MAKDFLEMVTELLLPEQLGEELGKDTAYKKTLSEEKRLYEQLEGSLNKEQQIILKDYFFIVNERISIIESLVYKKGMKDLLSLFKSLSTDVENKLLRISE